MELEAANSVQQLDFSLMALFIRATLTVKIVMVILLVSSVWSWSIIIQKFFDYARAWMKGTLPFLDITDGALFYHADYVTPGWAKTKQKTVEIQDHIFYRWDIK